MKKVIFLGILASLFFAATFILNRSMNLGGGYWMWSAGLRYLFMLPMSWILASRFGGAVKVLNEVKSHPFPWFLWSTVGFGLFYAPLTWASVYGESWFVAATWQLTIVAGILLTPLFGKQIPVKNLACSGIILAGVFLLQTSHFHTMQTTGTLTALGLILIAAFSYPLGNRKMMECCPPEFSTFQRVFGMTLCSMPFWLVISFLALSSHGLPSCGQTVQGFIVALFSGIIATLLFFEATNRSRHDARQLAMVEATQSGEVLFTLLGGILFLGDRLPSITGFAGILLIVIGMVVNSFAAAS